MNPLWWILILFGGGLLLLAIDVVIPSGGAMVVLAIISFIASIALAFSESVGLGLGVFTGETIFLSILVAMFVKWWPHSPLGRRILIQRSRVETEPSELSQDDPKNLIGVVGVAKSKLLPAGSVVIHGRRYDAVSKGMPIEQGQTIEVVAVEMNRVVVRPTDRRLSPKEPLERRGNSSLDDPLSQSIEELGLDPFEDPLS